MKIPKLFQKFQKKSRKLRATARAVPKQSAEDYDEPNMKLSSAFIVVLLLHVVAIGGIYTFSSYKAHQDNGGHARLENADAKPAFIAAASSDEAAKARNVKSTSAILETRTQADVKKPADPAEKHAMKDSGELYMVAKGDNPHAIARRLHVNYDEFLKLNKIDDPKKLQIGQKLRVPVKSKAN